MKPLIVLIISICVFALGWILATLLNWPALIVSALCLVFIIGILVVAEKGGKK